MKLHAYVTVDICYGLLSSVNL